MFNESAVRNVLTKEFVCVFTKPKSTGSRIFKSYGGITLAVSEIHQPKFRALKVGLLQLIRTHFIKKIVVPVLLKSEHGKRAVTIAM